MPKMQKLDLMGNVVKNPGNIAQTPLQSQVKQGLGERSSAIGQSGYMQKQYAGAVKKQNVKQSKEHPRQVTVTYGHNGGGKVYTYLADAGVRAGQTVTPYVTHYKSGKLYKTLGVVQSTRDSTNGPSMDTINHLSKQGIGLKTLGKTSQTTLPGYYAGWGADSKAAFDLNTQNRVKYGENSDEYKQGKATLSQMRRQDKQAYDEKVKMRKLNLYRE